MVYIEKLVCKGFKSFGRDTVTIKLSPGFTCIIGPNGSGKSNVVDALLFVLGQLSAKTLRASVFSELLYSPQKPGNPPKARTAVVQLHFNNEDRKLPIDTNKVVIERELDETGKSVCRINGKVVTRSAVLDLLSSIGVDPNGYNLVLQGETAQIVKVSPTDRRKLIEEIAGISAYDEQKERALKKLAESEANLSTVDAQLQERRRHLEKLELEKEDAVRYQKVKEEIQALRVNSLAWMIIKAMNRIKSINETLAEKAAEAEKLARELDEVEKKSIEIETESERIDNEIDLITGGNSTKISEEYGVLSAAIEHLTEILTSTKEELVNMINKKKILESNLETVKSEINEHEINIAEKEKKFYVLTEEIENTRQQILELEQALNREQEGFYEIQQLLQELNNELVSLDENISEIRSEIKAKERELYDTKDELEDAKNNLKTTEEEIEHLQEILPVKKCELNDCKKDEENKRGTILKREEQLKGINSEIAEIQRIIRETRDELIKMQTRKEALREAEESFLKKKKAVARILEMRDNGEIDGIYGTVAELGRIDPEFAVSLEIAGGNRLSYIVVNDENVATKCIEVLKRERIGRASFIPLNRIRSKSLSYLPDDERVIGYAMDLVKYDDKFEPAFQFVFSNTIVTEDFATAKRMGFKGWRAVSLDGDLVEKSGLITGGHYHKDNLRLSLQIDDKSSEIEEKLAGLEKILNELFKQQEELQKEIKQLEKESNEIAKKNYRAGIEIRGLEQQLENCKQRKKKLVKSIEQNRLQIQILEKQIIELREKDQERSAIRENIRQQQEKYSEMLGETKASQITRELKELKEILENMKEKQESLQFEISSLTVALRERLNPKAKEMEKEIKTIESIIPEMEKKIKELKEEVLEKKRRLGELRTEKERIENIVKDWRVRQIRLREETRNLRFRHEEIREKQTANEKAVYRLQTEQARLEKDIVGYKAELAELANVDQELSARTNLNEPSYRELEEFAEKIRGLERELTEMGPVNLKSLTDYDSERERYEEIVEKKTKLEEERKEILQFMEELEQEKTQKFLQVYNEIADNFSKVFAKLSPGGEASLILENPEHPLMGGITVRSKPAGKDIVSLDAMSGGEKTLTGLALIFAIQMYSPASFYVFDEIDAALDDVNAHNVALLISEMAKSSQFIVISLRDVTVSKADLLVGISNQNGISRVVSVDLEEVTESA